MRFKIFFLIMLFILPTLSIAKGGFSSGGRGSFSSGRSYSSFRSTAPSRSYSSYSGRTYSRTTTRSYAPSYHYYGGGYGGGFGSGMLTGMVMSNMMMQPYYMMGMMGGYGNMYNAPRYIQTSTPSMNISSDSQLTIPDASYYNVPVITSQPNNSIDYELAGDVLLLIGIIVTVIVMCVI